MSLGLAADQLSVQLFNPGNLLAMRFRELCHLVSLGLTFPCSVFSFFSPLANPILSLLAMFSLFYRLFCIVRMLVFGWPAYLTTHVTGRNYGTRTNHFEPNAPLFADNERWMVVLSDAALICWIGLLAYAGNTLGWLWVFNVYFVPYLGANGWLVLITYLHHTDVRLPHYRSEEWNWLKGALCTIDRDYGWLNHFHHHIADTHVAHHIFSYMPHYHAEEATRALKPILGKYYLTDTCTPGLRGVGEALWKGFTYCRYVEDEGQVLWYKH